MDSSRLTEPGRATRERIVRAAAALMHERGAAATSLDDVRAATRSSKSQLYHYFGDKHGLVQAVIDHQCATVLDAQVQALSSVNDWAGLNAWAETMVASIEGDGVRDGCPIGTLAAALAGTDEQFRNALNDAFDLWRAAIQGALTRLRDNGRLDPESDLDQLTTSTLAAVQGGLLLAKTSRDSSQLRAALDSAVAQLHACGPGPA